MSLLVGKEKLLHESRFNLKKSTYSPRLGSQKLEAVNKTGREKRERMKRAFFT